MTTPDEARQHAFIEARAARNWYKAQRKDWGTANAIERNLFLVGAAFEIACGL